MKRVLFPVLSLALVPMLAHAGTSTVHGDSVVRAKPEFKTINLTVQSECYADAALLDAQHKATVSALQEFLKAKLDKNNGVDELLTYGTDFDIFSGNSYGDKNDPCKNTFQMTTPLKFTIKLTPEFATVSASINNKITSDFRAGSEESIDARTYVKANRAIDGVCAEKREEMKLAAKELAYATAQKNFAEMAKFCSITSASLESASDSERVSRGYTDSYAEKMMAPSSDLQGGTPEIDSGFIEVKWTATLSYLWTGPTTACNLTK